MDLPPDQQELIKLEHEIESIGIQNGSKLWDARQLANWLGYTTWDSFVKVIHKARASVELIGIDAGVEFAKVSRNNEDNYDLTRFACFMTVLHADNRKHKVKGAQVILARIAQLAIDTGQIDIGRLEARERLSSAEKNMVGTASSYGLQSDRIAQFRDAGYRGMYNMPLSRIKAVRGIPQKHSLYDVVGSQELNANAFRADLTSKKITNEEPNTQGQFLEIAKSTGESVREFIQEQAGIYPENFPLKHHLPQTKSRLKKSKKQLNNKKSEKP